MDAKNTKDELESDSIGSKPTKSEKNDNPYLKIKQRASDSTKTSLNAALSASKNLNDNLRSNFEKAKESPSYKEIQDKLSNLEKTLKTTQSGIRKNSPKVFSKIKGGFLGGFEQIVGRVRIGTQYGKSSIDLLSDLAKLKELGIITEEEFNLKKKEILDRI